MCGITGFYDTKHEQNQYEELINKMMDSIAHRGIDGASSYIQPPFALAHNRLKIIDFSDDARQPMHFNNTVITFNGEIYNYIELRRELEARQYQFETESDTEVVLKAYHAWGDNCVDHFVGMWAFVILDKLSGEMFCSRDRFGIKPFYYSNNQHSFYFASEYKPLKLTPYFSNQLNLKQVNRGLSLGWVTHHDESYYTDIWVLPPACNLRWTPKGIHIWQYWNIDSKKKVKLSHEEKKYMFSKMFRESLHIHMRSDAVVGGCLSGGLDSSSIASLIAKDYSERDYKIFNIYYNGENGNFYDERPFVNEVLTKYPRIKPHFFTPSDIEIVEGFDRVNFFADTPVNGSSYISQYFLMKQARDNNVRVLIDGQGADEYLGGYLHTLYPVLAGHMSSFKFKSTLELLSSHIKRQNYGAKETAILLAKTLTTLLKSDEFIYQHEYEKIKGMLNQAEGEDFGLKFIKFSNNIIDNFLYNLTMFTSLPTLLHFGDRNSMAFGVEGRVPFLDHRLVEFVFSIDNEDKINNKAETKSILRHAMADVLPQAIAQRKDKKGFVTPGEKSWLRGPLEHMLNIDHKQLTWLNQQKISNMISAYKKGDNSQSKYIWRIAALNYWMQTNNVSVG
jgi:asparagine synthase (glutamine-hydrolysing)